MINDRMRVFGFIAITLILALTVGCLGGSSSKTYTLTITVEDQAGNPLQGVSLKVGNTTDVTNVSGAAVFAGVSGNVAIEAALAGYSSYSDTKRIDKDTILQITLAASAEHLVGSAADLSTAVSQVVDGDTIRLTADITADLSLDRLVNLDLDGHQLNGNVTFISDSYGVMTIGRGTINGNVTVDLENATVSNEATVTGTIQVIGVADETWKEYADGNRLIIEDENGANIVIEGNPEFIEVSRDASGVLRITVRSGGRVGSIVADAPLNIEVESGAEVDSVEVNAEGTSLSNNGRVGTVAANADMTITLEDEGEMPEVESAEGVQVTSNSRLTLIAVNGDVTGGGTYYEGDAVALTATPHVGHNFANWTQGEEIVSNDAQFTFTMPGRPVTLTANFVASGNATGGTISGEAEIGDSTSQQYVALITDSAGDPVANVNVIFTVSSQDDPTLNNVSYTTPQVIPTNNQGEAVFDLTTSQATMDHSYTISAAIDAADANVDSNWSSNLVVIVVRTAEPDPDLASLTVSSGTLSPSFNKDVTSYTVDVSSGTSSVNVTATLWDDEGSFLQINGTPQASGQARSISLGSAGTSRTIDILVTASDGTTTKTYRVVVNRAAPPVVDVTGVSVLPAEMNLTAGGTPDTITATVTPGNATDKRLTWSSSNTDVATVSNGVVTPHAEGTAIITVETRDGGYTASCQATVGSPIQVMLHHISAEEDGILISIFKTINDEDSYIDDLSIDDFVLIKDFGGAGETVITNVTLYSDALFGTFEYEIRPETAFAEGSYRLGFSKGGYHSQHIDLIIGPDPCVSELVFSPGFYPAGVEQTISVTINTSEVEDNTPVALSLVGSDVDQIIAGPVNGVILNNTATLEITAPNTLDAGIYYFGAEMGKATFFDTVIFAEIVVKGQGEVSDIWTDGGTLQMTAAVEPFVEEIENIAWSVLTVLDGGVETGYATIDGNGLLTAVTDGTVTVIATDQDGSGVQGEKTITIYGQNPDIEPKVSITPGSAVFSYEFLDRGFEISYGLAIDLYGLDTQNSTIQLVKGNLNSPLHVTPPIAMQDLGISVLDGTVVYDTLAEASTAFGVDFLSWGGVPDVVVLSLTGEFCGEAWAIFNEEIVLTDADKAAFLPLLPAAVVDMAVTQPPGKTTYTEGDRLDLTGIEVTLYKSDLSVEVVGFEGFRGAGITTAPTHGTALNTANTQVTMTHDQSGINKSQPITVNPGTPVGLDLLFQDPQSPTGVWILVYQDVDPDGLEGPRIPGISAEDFTLTKDYGYPNPTVIENIRLVDSGYGSPEYSLLPPVDQVFIEGDYQLVFAKEGYQTTYLNYTVSAAE